MSTSPSAELDALRYPIGKARVEPAISAERRRELIDQIAAAPDELRRQVEDLSDERLDTPYRPGGWTVRQLVHHVADSHMNACIRVKLALTEDAPPIKTYEEHLWAQLEDGRAGRIDTSLAILDALHERWDRLLRSLPEASFARSCHHPEWGAMTIDQLLQIYAWHGRHHAAHVGRLREREGW